MAFPLFCRSALLLLALFICAPASKAAEAKKILVIGTKPDHPYETHMYMHECGLLAKCLQQTPGIETVVSLGWPTNAESLKGIKAVVLYSNPGGNVILDPKARPQAEQLFNDGAGYVAVHWATDCKPEWGEDYLKLLGGWFSLKFSGLHTTNTIVEQMDGSHPVCRGWRNFELHDEIYLNLKFLPESKPLIKVKARDKDQVVGWTYERPGGGRSFGTTLGHYHRNFGNESFRRLVVNGILWAAHIDVPTNGAPVQISAEDMKLPPPEKK